MSSQSPILSLPYIQPAQAQKHVTHNEALRQLDTLVQLAVVDATLTVPPVSPPPEARYIVGTGATGDWAGQDNAVALFADGAWVFYTPVAGWRADVLSTSGTMRFDGTTWSSIAQGVLQNVDLVGVNTTADATNRLSVSADATLLTHDGAGHQLKLNKSTVTDTASLLFQTGFSGRAEMGLAGGDDFSIKVSPDGATFLDAVVVDAQTGQVMFPNGGPDFRERLTAHQTYFVRPDGDNANDGLANTSAGAFATIQHAVDEMMRLDCGIYDVTINVAAGTYAETVTISGQAQGSGTYTLRGNTGAPDTVKVNKIRCRKTALISLEGFEFITPNGLEIQTRAQVDLRFARFSGAGNAISIRDGFVGCNNTDLQFASTVTTIASAYNYANLSMFGTNFILDANINWGASGAFFMNSFCLAWLQSATFTGATASCTGSRYNIGLNSILNTAGQGATFIPGNAVGLVGTGAQYV